MTGCVVVRHHVPLPVEVLAWLAIVLVVVGLALIVYGVFTFVRKDR